MEIAYHRNCLDGVYSAYLLYLLAKSLSPQALEMFIKRLHHQNQNLNEGEKDMSEDSMRKI